MQRPSTSTHPRSVGFDAREQGWLDAQVWLRRRFRWEHRLSDLHALAGLESTSLCLEARQRAVQACSGVLERPGRSSGVCA